MRATLTALLRKIPRAGVVVLIALVVLALLVPAQGVTASTNVVGNPGFETGTSGWNTSGSGTGITLAQVSGGHSGSFAAQLTNTGTANSACLLNDSPNWAKTTSAGQYTGSLWVRADTAGATLNLRFREYSTSGPLLGSKTTSVKLTTSWQQVTVTIPITTPGSTLDFDAYVSSAAPGPCFYADDASIVNTPASGSPPSAALTVTPTSGAAPLQVSADASASTAGSSSISSYKFDFGDGTVVGPQSGATASHTYSSTGTFTVTVTVTDSAGLSSTATSSVSVTGSTGAQVTTFVGYYDTHHSITNPKPSPWQGSPNVVFQGTPDSSSGGWDSGAIRIDNNSSVSLPFVSVTVDIGTHHFALWNTVSLPANATLILAQTAFQNFDTSDTSPAGCYGCDPTLCTTEVVSTKPVVHVTVDAVTTNYTDTNQVLNTRGVDGAGCNPPAPTNPRNDESQVWQQLSGP